MKYQLSLNRRALNKMLAIDGVKGVCKEQYNLSHLTWLKVGGPADIFFKPKDVADLSKLLTVIQGKYPVTVLGAGSNIIIRDKGIEGVVIKLGQGFTDISISEDGKLIVGAGCLNYNLAQFCKVNSIKGFEFLVGIPGTIGGGVFMNAGCYSAEFKDIVEAVEIVAAGGQISVLKNYDIGFIHRGSNLPMGSIVTRVWFKQEKGDLDQITKVLQYITNKRQESQPIKEKTGGSTFVNPAGHKAWELIDNAGMRGARVGGASMSKLHCNFMINDGTASASDMEDLGELVRQKVYENSGILLDWEIKRIGRK